MGPQEGDDVQAVGDIRQKARWWVISEDMLIGVLRAAAGGEDPDVLMMEMSANSQHGEVTGVVTNEPADNE